MIPFSPHTGSHSLPEHKQSELQSEKRERSWWGKPSTLHVTTWKDNTCIIDCIFTVHGEWDTELRLNNTIQKAVVGCNKVHLLHYCTWVHHVSLDLLSGTLHLYSFTCISKYLYFLQSPLHFNNASCYMFTLFFFIFLQAINNKRILLFTLPLWLLTYFYQSRNWMCFSTTDKMSQSVLAVINDSGNDSHIHTHHIPSVWNSDPCHFGVITAHGEEEEWQEVAQQWSPEGKFSCSHDTQLVLLHDDPSGEHPEGHSRDVDHAWTRRQNTMLS